MLGAPRLPSPVLGNGRDQFPFRHERTRWQSWSAEQAAPTPILVIEQRLPCVWMSRSTATSIALYSVSINSMLMPTFCLQVGGIHTTTMATTRTTSAFAVSVMTLVIDDELGGDRLNEMRVGPYMRNEGWEGPDHELPVSIGSNEGLPLPTTIPKFLHLAEKRCFRILPVRLQRDARISVSEPSHVVLRTPAFSSSKKGTILHRAGLRYGRHTLECSKGGTT